MCRVSCLTQHRWPVVLQTDLFMESMGAAADGDGAAAATLLPTPTLNVLPPPSGPPPPPGSAPPPPSMPPPSGPPPSSAGDRNGGESEAEAQASRQRERMDSDFRNAVRKLQKMEDERERDKRRAAARATELVERDRRAATRQRDFEKGYDDADAEQGDDRHYREAFVTRQRRARDHDRRGWEAADRALEDGPSVPVPVKAEGGEGGEAAVVVEAKVVGSGIPPPAKVAASVSRATAVARPTAQVAAAIFNPDDDDEAEEEARRKKRKLVKVTYTDEQMRAAGIDPEEERRKRSREIINAIPTERDALFGHKMHWEAMDTMLIDSRLKPWVDRKITEFIGAPEPTLVDFICGKVAARTSPRDIVSEIVAVLDDEAEIFVMKMWRVVVYETEFKKAGL